MAMLGNFAFLAGKPNAELTAFKPEECRQTYMILVPGNKDLEHMILHTFHSQVFLCFLLLFLVLPTFYRWALYLIFYLIQ